MDILNFISWIRGRRVVTSADPASSLLPVALKDGNRDDSYLTAAISVQNFATQVSAVIPPGAQGPQGPQGVPGPVGPAGLNWQGAWVSGASYVVDDAVGFGGASWFCINNTSGTTNPSADPTSWALLASQGATGPQGPQGIQGPQGPPGSGGTGSVPNGSMQYQTLYWTGTQWSPSSLLTNTNFGRIGINGVNTSSSHALTVFVNPALNGNGGFRMQNFSTGGSIYNLIQTPTSTFQFGLNPPSANPIFDSSMFFTMNQAKAIKFATGFTAGGGDRLIIQGNGQVVVGATVPTDPNSATLVVTTKSIELEDIGAGIYMRSPNGLRWFVGVSDGGALTVVPA